MAPAPVLSAVSGAIIACLFLPYQLKKLGARPLVAPE